MNQTLASLEEREVRDATLEADVVLVGAGPVGLMMANLLGLAGVQVLLLERSDGLLGLPRAIFYDSETLRLFTQVGLFDEIAPGLVLNPHVRHLNARGKALMQMDFPDRNIYGHSACGTFYQPDFERVLLQGTSRFGNVRVLFNHSFVGFDQNETHVTLKVATPNGDARFRAKYAIGCDGGTSAVRDMIGAKLLGSTFSERWLVVDAIVKDNDVTQITFNCDPRRPRVELPAVGDRVRWEFMQLPGETEETLKRDETIRSLITQHRKNRQFQIERKAVYTFHARVADRWRLGRVFLAGDAAHLMPPFAGQGMNGGMKDAVNLSWKLAAVISGQADEAVLATYEAERSAVIRKMVALSRRLGTMIMPTSKPAAFARDMIFTCLNLSGRFRAFIAKGGVLPPPKIRPQCAYRNRPRFPDRADDAAADRHRVARKCTARRVSDMPSMAGSWRRHRSGSAAFAARSGDCGCARCAVHLPELLRPRRQDTGAPMRGFRLSRLGRAVQRQSRAYPAGSLRR